MYDGAPDSPMHYATASLMGGILDFAWMPPIFMRFNYDPRR